MMEAIISVVLSVVSFIISICSVKEKGLLLNNAYLFASEAERRKMDKKPYYRQTAIVFCLLGILFLILTIETIKKMKWLHYIAFGIMMAVIVYAILSTIMIWKNSNKK